MSIASVSVHLKDGESAYASAYLVDYPGQPTRGFIAVYVGEATIYLPQGQHGIEAARALADGLTKAANQHEAQLAEPPAPEHSQPDDAVPSPSEVVGIVSPEQAPDYQPAPVDEYPIPF